MMSFISKYVRSLDPIHIEIKSDYNTIKIDFTIIYFTEFLFLFEL